VGKREIGGRGQTVMKAERSYNLRFRPSRGARTKIWFRKARGNRKDLDNPPPTLKAPTWKSVPSRGGGKEKQSGPKPQRKARLYVARKQKLPSQRVEPILPEAPGARPRAAIESTLSYAMPCGRRDSSEEMLIKTLTFDRCPIESSNFQ
jgi:hypothetical protein